MGRRKRKSAKQHPSCSVCQSSYVPHHAFFLPCSSYHDRPDEHMCLTCGYQHIYTTLSNNITSAVGCPAKGCSMVVPVHLIESTLARFNAEFLQEYMTRRYWHGTSEQWVKTFAARCPFCSVPIEKNGGCNQVVCSRCHQRFDWQLAKTSTIYPHTARLITAGPRFRFFLSSLFILFAILLVIVGGYCAIDLVPKVHSYFTGIGSISNMF